MRLSCIVEGESEYVIRGKIIGLLRRIDPTIPDLTSWQPETRHSDGSVTSDALIGTLDYASPEQALPEKFREDDNYESILLRNIPKLYPEVEDKCKYVAKLWRSFRNFVIKELAEDTRKLWPIHYSLPLIELNQATSVFVEIKKILTGGGEICHRLLPPFLRLYKAHLELLAMIEQPLKRDLKLARQGPFIY